MIKLSNYKIKRKIASGGMGDVYLAEHEVLETIVAIKSLHSNLVGDESFRKRFRTEAKTHSKLIHPNIVKLIDFQEQKDGLFLIMEYIEGKQLNDYITKVTGPIPEEKLIPLFLQVLSAIEYAHSKTVIHRDIKPANIIITPEGNAKVIDFGIAKQATEDHGLTKTGVQVGTVSYMSPEQVNAEKVDLLTDIYSLGVTLFQMAVGQSPYVGATNTFKIQLSIINDPFPNAKDIYPSISDKLVAIIEKATQKDKKDRYQSCEEFKEDLNAKPEKSKVNIPPKVKKEVVKKESSSSSKVLTRLLLIGVVIFVGYLFSNNYFKQQKEKDYVSYYESGKKYQEDELYQTAINYYNKCINVYPDCDSIIAFKADCYHEKGAYQDAIDNFTKAIDMTYRMNADYYAGRGKSYSKLRKHRDAQIDFDKAIKIDPDNAGYHLLKGMGYLEDQYQNSSAIRSFNKSLSLEKSAVAFYKRGNAKYKLGKLADAISDYTNAIIWKKNYTEAYRNRGIARYETCKDGACDDLKKACDLGDRKACTEHERIKNKSECE